MGEVLFTTNDVATILRVDKSTVKRWTDEGKLKCFRTPGGHRKFRSEDLYDFIAAHNYGNLSLQSLPQIMSDEMIIRSIIHKKEFNVLHSVCFSAAIKGKKQEILSLFSESISGGLTLTGIFDHIVRPTVKKLGLLLSQGKISVSEFHLAQNVITASIIQLNDSVKKQPRNQKTVVCASIDNGKNEMELVAVITMLELNGFTALNLGSGISAEEINQFLVRTKPFAVCLHTSFTENAEKLVSELKKVAAIAKACGAHCIVAGNAFDRNEVKQLDDVKFCGTYEEIGTMQFGNVKSNVKQ
ncbi:MAG: helix-turn-helix domain-containing protein [Bacteroidota bacterium]|jgi:excisionase family DNA binding protein